MPRQYNVGLKSIQGDSHYRWKMDPLETKIEGKGIGRKTVLLNISEVAAHCFTQPQYMTKFFGYEIGAQSKWDDHRRVGFVNGVHDTNDLQELVFKYIELLIMCPSESCTRPEIKYMKTGKNIRMACASCGLNQNFQLDHQITKFIVNSWDDMMAKKKSGGENDIGKKTGPKRRRRRKKNPEEEEEEEKAVAVVVEEKPEDKIQPLKVDDPVKALKELVKTKKTKEFAILFQRIQKGHEFDDVKMGSVFINTILNFDSETDFMDSIDKYSGFIRWYVSEGKNRDIFMDYFEEMMVYSDYIDSAAHIFAKFHEKIIFQTDFLVHWFESDKTSSVVDLSPDDIKNLKEYVEPFIDYLREGTFDNFETYFANNYEVTDEEEEEEN